MTSCQRHFHSWLLVVWWLKTRRECKLLLMLSTNTKLALQLKNDLGSQTDEECCHIIRLRLIARIIGLYVIILECCLGCEHDYMRGSAVCVLGWRVDEGERFALTKLINLLSIVGALNKFTKQFSRSSIKLWKFAIVLGICRDAGKCWKGYLVVLFGAGDKKAPSKCVKWEIALAQLLFH